MKLFQLRYFCAVCRSSSLSKASKEVYVSQPTLSLAIKELETELGIRLFLRSSNRLTLTQEGAFLFEHATVLLEQADSLARKMLEFRDREFTVQCGMPPVMAGFFIPRLRRFSTQLKGEAPNVTIEVTEHSLKEIAENLGSGLLDLAFCTVERNTLSQFGQQVIYKSPMKLCVGPSHRLSALKTASIEDFKGEPIIAPHRSNSFVTKLIIAWFAKYGLKPNFRYYFSQLRTMESLIKNNMAVALARPEFQILDKTIVCIPLNDPIEVVVSLLWNKSLPMRSEVATVIGLLKSYDFGSLD